MRPGRLIGVGVGPGDPEHLTLKALAALERADRVFVPETGAGAPGRAERIVAPHVDAGRVERLAFAMGGGPRRAESWDRAGAAIAAVVERGGTAAFATVGDPSLYSTFGYVAWTVRGLAPGVAIEVVPGITALQDLAARSGTVLAEGDETLALVPAPAGEERLRAALDGSDCVVVYKAGRELARVLGAVRTAGRIDDAVHGEQLGLDGERLGPAAERERSGRDGDAGPAPYMSTLIVLPRRDGARGSRLPGGRS